MSVPETKTDVPISIASSSPPTPDDHCSVMTCAVNFIVCQEITLRLQKEVFILSLIDAVSLSLLIVFLSSSSQIFTWVTDRIRFRRIVSLGHLVWSEQRWKISRDSFTESTFMIWTTMKAFKGQFHWVHLYDLNNDDSFQGTVLLGQIVWSEQWWKISRDSFTGSTCMIWTTIGDSKGQCQRVSLYGRHFARDLDTFSLSQLVSAEGLSVCELINS